MGNDNNSTVYIMCECVTNPDDIHTDIINESTSTDNSTGNKLPTVTLDTNLQSFEVRNWNDRIYGAQLVMDSLDKDGMIQNDIKRGQWVGEYGHPLDADAKRQMTLYPPNCSHRILKYRREGNLLKGIVQTLLTDVGIAMANNCKLGMPAAFSLRSLGSVDLATRRVKAPLKIITYDSVIRPSHIEAYQNQILSESAMPEQFLNESALFAPISESMEDILGYVKEKSTNLSIVADMFKLDELNCVLTENASRLNVFIDEDTKVSVPIESAINMQYSDLLSSFVDRRREGR